MKFHLSQQIESKEPERTFKIDKSFSTKTTSTERTNAIGEAFGIGLDEEKKFEIFKDFEFDINPGQVVLITGDSGSGKSTALREIQEQLRDSKEALQEFKGPAIRSDFIEINENEILIEGVGRDAGEAISILSMAGLNEAFLMLRKFKELSDGQKYRFRVAKMISKSDAGIWIFDEFAAVLDRVTAKVVSYTLQKTARRLGKTVIVATTHEDMVRDLKPDLWIRKQFGAAAEVRYFPNLKRQWSDRCSLLKAVKVEPCNAEEIESLDQFHYRGGAGWIVRWRFKATIEGELGASISYVYPHIALRGRNIALPEYAGKVTSEHLKKINKEIVRISRVIVAPKFRSIGLGAYIVKKTMPMTNMKIVETLAIMARYNPFFQVAGMKKVEVPKDEQLEKEINELESFGFRRELLASKGESLKILSHLEREDLEKVAKFALRNCVGNKYRKPRLIPGVKALDIETIAEALKNVKSNAVYLWWRNPDLKIENNQDLCRAHTLQ